tara:strand:- start:205 stop:690 length:486 start_codon:yes stop_codon:yes gene_type:complete
MSSNQGKIYDLNEAREKIRGYCLYRERSQKEVRDKLLSYGLFPEIADTLLSELILERFVDEERFARAFVRGKYKIKKWGRIKIKQALYPHQLSAYVLKKAFSEIDPELYYQNLITLCQKRWPLSKGSNDYVRRSKLIGYLQRQGYEMDLIRDAVEAELGRD